MVSNFYLHVGFYLGCVDGMEVGSHDHGRWHILQDIIFISLLNRGKWTAQTLGNVGCWSRAFRKLLFLQSLLLFVLLIILYVFSPDRHIFTFNNVNEDLACFDILVRDGLTCLHNRFQLA